MNKEQLIALGLTEEQADSVIAGFGTMIPKSRFDEKIDEAKELKQQLADRDTQLKELSDKAGDNEALTAQIKSLQEQNETTASEYETKLKQKDFDFKLSEALRDAKARNPRAVIALLNTDSIKLDGDTLIGLDEQLKALKTSDDYLFVADGLKGKTPPGAQKPPGDNSLTKEQFDAMPYSEKAKLYNEDLETYNKFTQ
ncbi:hypothetical protein BK128_09670 [Viridibacillus sp. FSL H7-0596]|uniref:phage scaffolding protein n=1 Tax=Viridibacillus sp. FSL H7-0596 TaxID=1928923 RepID=UPI00096F2426|nr:phage scaffolding protein [Viridibacillus sp. FSL H7-0596]OMC86923.1 hypothetical protein BK128_09670 [Viridibacillus sp. FSL H7-0596]